MLVPFPRFCANLWQVGMFQVEQTGPAADDNDLVVEHPLAK
jgi:hypothetical protein